MGGLGSGEWYRSGSRSTVEGCHSIDVRRLHREGFLVAGNHFRWAWSRDGQEVASIGVLVGTDAVELRYFLDPNSDNARKIQYTVPLTWTPCTYGGKRPWFRCPGAVDGQPCGRRVAKLYDPGIYFLCRHCYNLTYQSRRAGSGDRGRIRTQAIRVQLGGSANLLEPFPPKPKGMHRRTYERLRCEAEAGEEQWVLGLQAWLDRRQARTTRISSRPS